MDVIFTQVTLNDCYTEGHLFKLLLVAFIFYFNIAMPILLIEAPVISATGTF